MTENSTKDSLSPAHGVILCLITTLIAEIIFESSVGPINYFSAIGRVSVSFLGLYTVHRFASMSFRRYRTGLKDLICLHLILIGSVLMVSFGRIVGIGLSKYLEDSSIIGPIAAGAFDFSIPFAAGGLILQAVLGLQAGLVFAISLSIIIGVYSPNQAFFVPYVLATTLVACLSLSRFRSRSAYVKAGLNIALISFPFVLATVVIEGDLFAPEIAVRMIGPLIAGGLCTFIAAGVTPIVEYVGGYVTDMRLIEMATLDHPLLKELSIQAPGTWNHSMVMGMMVEQAADAIGANPVLARVGAYFHDIGKMKKPLYFVENQGGGENRHDKLSTSMSALIIRSHVKDGIELARKHKIPQSIEDMIPQHHGTSMIEFFYNKAKKEVEEGSEETEVDKSLYSYPGPKPQTREAGLLMLADGIEASARTLTEPTHDRIQGLVQKMINKVFASGELNECELTLKDLHLIAKCFTHVLSGIYHQRVAYAEPAEKVREKPVEQEQEKGNQKNGSAKELAGADSSQDSEPESEKDESKEGSKEDLKRLGM